MKTEMTATNTTTTVVNMPVLQVGTQGEAVRFLQQHLIAYGYLGNNSFDAIFGQNTERGVKEFQSDYGLRVDGIVGKQTWRKLGDVIPRPNFAN